MATQEIGSLEERLSSLACHAGEHGFESRMVRSRALVRADETTPNTNQILWSTSKGRQIMIKIGDLVLWVDVYKKHWWGIITRVPDISACGTVKWNEWGETHPDTQTLIQWKRKAAQVAQW